jgi:alpha-galactosidase
MQHSHFSGARMSHVSFRKRYCQSVLQVGNSNDLMYGKRAESHFALWAIIKAPLLIGADLRSLDERSLAILRNKEVIAVNQDALGVAGDLIYTHGDLQV